MKGLFIPGITTEVFKNATLESVERFMAEGEMQDIEYPQKQVMGYWKQCHDDYNDWLECSECGYGSEGEVKLGEETKYCPECGAKMRYPTKSRLKSRMCDQYCKWPNEWEGEGELADSIICKSCPLNEL